MKLLEPTTVGRTTLPSRIAITSHAGFPGLYDPRESGDAYAAYLARRADGVGMIVLQCAFPPFAGIDAPIHASFGEKLSRFRVEAGSHGAAVLIQIAHQGVNARGLMQPDLRPLFGMSAMQSEVCADVAHEMEPWELDALVEGFGQVAEIASAAGLDGVELHAAHGYLLHQSMSPWSNVREDDWGEQTHLLERVLRRVRTAVGEGIVGVRMPSNNHRTPEAARQIDAGLVELSARMVRTGLLDYLSPTEGSQIGHYHRVIGTYRRPHGDFLPGAAAVRRAVAGAVPVLAVGRLVSPDDAEAALADGSCDIVGMTRALISDPDLGVKLRRGEVARVRPCVGANQGCIDRAHEGAPMTCFHNPDVGREHRVAAVARAAAPRQVVVVGGGPAGLKAAEIAARRGHTVTLLEASTRLGGRLASITSRTGAAELSLSIDWIVGELAHLGVDVRTGTRADAALLADLAPDAVIVATGSTPAAPPFPTDGSIPVLSTDEALDTLEDVAHPRNLLVYDTLGNEEAAVAYEQLAAGDDGITIVTPSAPIGRYLGHTHATDHVQRLVALGCRIEERTTIESVAEGHVLTTAALTATSELRAFDAIVLAAPRRPDTTLVAAARAVALSVVVIGDAYAPRTAMHAFRDGDNAGRAV